MTENFIINTSLPTIGLAAIARPTFDVALARSVAEQALEQLEGAGYTVVGTRAELLMDDADAAKAVQALTQADYDLLVVLQASFADSTMAVQIAQASQMSGAPTLLWAVPDERQGGRLRLNSLCGINLAGHAFTHHDLAYDYLLSPSDDRQALAKIDPLARAGRAWRLLRTTRIGLVGQHPAGFDTCVYDDDELQHLFGAAVIPLALEETLQRAREVAAPERQVFVERVAAHARNVNELDSNAVAGTAGVYTALRAIADEQKLDGIAVRCWPEFFTELGCAACGAMSVLCDEGTPASCEADVNGTLTLVLLQAISGEQAFITDLVSIEAESDSGVLWHCGLAPFHMADPESEIVGALHSNRKLPLLFEFPLKPGRVTIARLNRTPNAQGETRYRLVIGGGEMVRAPKSFSGTSGVIRFDCAAVDVLDTVMTEGLEHHFCISYGDHSAALRAFAQLANLPVLDLTV